MKIKTEWLQIQDATDSRGPVERPMVQAMWDELAMPADVAHTIKGCPCGSAHVVQGDREQAARLAVLNLLARTNAESGTTFEVHVTGAIDRGEAVPVVEVTSDPRYLVVPWHGEARSLFYVMDTAAPSAHAPSPLLSSNRRPVADDLAARLNRGEITAYQAINRSLDSDYLSDTTGQE